MPAGIGRTWWFGDAEYSTAGSATEQQLARIHELVHAFLRPRFRFLRRFRARLNASAYTRSAILKYLEEGLAETIAQLSEIGTIMLGSQWVSVQIVVGPPAAAHSAQKTN